MRTIRKLRPQETPQPQKAQERIRRPRPMGITLLCKEYNRNHTNTTLLSTIHNKIIGEYVQKGFYLQGTQLTITQLATYLNVPMNYVIKKVQQSIQAFAGMGAEADLKGLTSALKISVFGNLLQARHTANQQVTRLLGSQGSGHKAFVSADVNASIGTLLAADRNMMQMIGIMEPKQGITINTGDTVQNNAYLTTDRAVEILGQKGHTGILKSEEKRGTLHTLKGIGTLPEVVATKQQGFEVQAIPDLKALTVIKGTETKLTHADRNEIDGTILEPDL